MFSINGYVVDNTDCDDSEMTVNPNQFEICGFDRQQLRRIHR